MDAFRGLPERRLVVAGDGPALPRLRAMAPSNVSFRGHLDDHELVPLMQRCAAVLFPSRDDFGLIPVEAMACGRPVLAYGAGGALETVVPGRTGEFFDRQEVEAVRAAIADFDPAAYDPAAIRAHALGWRRERFVDELRAIAFDVAGRAPLRWRA
jgi:glycosyltransferase involved in cell wall biosynthesis